MIEAPGSVPSATEAEAALAADSSPMGEAARWALGLLSAPGLPSEESVAARVVPSCCSSSFAASRPRASPSNAS